MLCHAPEARRLRTTRHLLPRPLRSGSALYLIVCVASAGAAALGIATLFDDEAPVPHASQAIPWRADAAR